jgi:hypothetical protein
LTIVFICNSLDFSAIEAFERKTTLSEDFISSKFHFVKQIVGGIFVTIHGRFGSGFNAGVVPPLAKLKKTCSLLQDICRD